MADAPACQTESLNGEERQSGCALGPKPNKDGPRSMFGGMQKRLEMCTVETAVKAEKNNKVNSQLWPQDGGLKMNLEVKCKPRAATVARVRCSMGSGGLLGAECLASWALGDETG